MSNPARNSIDLSDSIRALISGADLHSVVSQLLEKADGTKAATEKQDCHVCGSKAATRAVIPRHGRDEVTRCPECGQNVYPGDNTVRGATNYTGSPGSFYDESSE